MAIESLGPPGEVLNKLSSKKTPERARVAGAILTKIVTGEIPPGSKLPSAKELKEEYGVSVGTINNALKVIAPALVSRGRQGVYVREEPLSEEEITELTASLKKQIPKKEPSEHPKLKDSRYRKIALDIISCLGRRYLQGAVLPSSEELADNYSASVGTIQAAVSILVEYELIERRRGGGGGTFVTETLPSKDELKNITDQIAVTEEDRTVTKKDEPNENIKRTLLGTPLIESTTDIWAESIRKRGDEPTQDIYSEIQQPSERIAKRLKIDQKESIIVTKRDRFINGTPYDHTILYIPAKYLADLDIADQQSLDVSKLASKERREISVRMPTPAEEEIFGIPSTQPLMIHTTTSFDNDGNLFCLGYQIIPTDRGKIVFSRTISPKE